MPRMSAPRSRREACDGSPFDRAVSTSPRPSARRTARAAGPERASRTGMKACIPPPSCHGTGVHVGRADPDAEPTGRQGVANRERQALRRGEKEEHGGQRSSVTRPRALIICPAVADEVQFGVGRAQTGSSSRGGYWPAICGAMVATSGQDSVLGAQAIDLR